MFTFHYLNDAPLIDLSRNPDLGGNINGPSLIKAPDWLGDSPARYLLYFAHHEGDSIRLACSDNLTGPWWVHRPAPLTLTESGFATMRVEESALHPDAREAITHNADGDYPHIASPDVWVDHNNRQIRIYFHGRLKDGRQCTRVALSSDGINFTVQPNNIGAPYIRIFRHQEWFYALAMPAQLSRSNDGMANFATGPQLTNESIRHHALLKHQQQWFVFWSRVGDSPERILGSKLVTDGDWMEWRFYETFEVHQAERSWEGADQIVSASEYGSSMQAVNQLRDPAIFVENERIYLLYSIAGEQGIALGELKFTPSLNR